MRIKIIILIMLSMILFSLFIKGDRINLVIAPECYKAGENITLYINLPVKLDNDVSNLQLKMTISGVGMSYSEVLSGDQISVYVIEAGKAESILEIQKANFKITTLLAFQVSLSNEASGNLVTEIELFQEGKAVSVLKSLIPDEKNCSRSINGRQNNNSAQTEGVPVGKKDYRERFIYGNIIVDETSWPDFNLILKAEKSIGGGVERAYIKIHESGIYSYRLGNLYPGDYVFEIQNMDNEVNGTVVSFGQDDISKKIDINIPRIAPVNFKLYKPEIINKIVREDGTISFELKAYVCRFDNSKVRNLLFNWQFSGVIYYNTWAPERERCLPLYPAPVILKPDEQIKIEMQVNPLLQQDSSSVAKSDILETDRSDNSADIFLHGGK